MIDAQSYFGNPRKPTDCHPCPFCGAVPFDQKDPFYLYVEHTKKCWLSKSSAIRRVDVDAWNRRWEDMIKGK
jgi:hypothetical protein